MSEFENFIETNDPTNKNTNGTQDPGTTAKRVFPYFIGLSRLQRRGNRILARNGAGFRTP